MTEQVTRLFVVDDHRFIIDGVKRMLEKCPEFIVSGEALTAEDALHQLKSGSVEADIVMTDLSLPKMGGIELVKELKRSFDTLKIIVLTMHDSVKEVRAIAEAEAEGYLLKSGEREEFLKAIERVAGGSTYYTNAIVPHLFKSPTGFHKEPYHNLTDREVEILKLILEEKTSIEIADLLFISKRTVDTHRSNILEKTHCKTLISLYKYAMERGLTTS